MAKDKKKIKKDGKLKKRGLIKKVTGKITQVQKEGDVIFTPHGIRDDEGRILDIGFTLDD